MSERDRERDQQTESERELQVLLMGEEEKGNKLDVQKKTSKERESERELQVLLFKEYNVKYETKPLYAKVGATSTSIHLIKSSLQCCFVQLIEAVKIMKKSCLKTHLSVSIFQNFPTQRKGTTLRKIKRKIEIERDG